MHCLGHAQDFFRLQQQALYTCVASSNLPVSSGHVCTLWSRTDCVKTAPIVCLQLPQFHLSGVSGVHVHSYCQLRCGAAAGSVCGHCPPGVSPEFLFCYTVRYWAGGCDVWCSIACDPCKGVSALGADVWWGWCLQDNLSLKAQGGAKLQCSAAAFCVGHHRQILDTVSFTSEKSSHWNCAAVLANLTLLCMSMVWP